VSSSEPSSASIAAWASFSMAYSAQRNRQQHRAAPVTDQGTHCQCLHPSACGMRLQHPVKALQHLPHWWAQGSKTSALPNGHHGCDQRCHEQENGHPPAPEHQWAPALGTGYPVPHLWEQATRCHTYEGVTLDIARLPVKVKVAVFHIAILCKRLHHVFLLQWS
jgi:hypothetical protein